MKLPAFERMAWVCSGPKLHQALDRTRWCRWVWRSTRSLSCRAWRTADSSCDRSIYALCPHSKPRFLTLKSTPSTTQMLVDRILRRQSISILFSLSKHRMLDWDPSNMSWTKFPWSGKLRRWLSRAYLSKIGKLWNIWDSCIQYKCRPRDNDGHEPRCKRRIGSNEKTLVVLDARR